MRCLITSVALVCTATISVAAPDAIFLNGNIYPEASHAVKFEAMAVDGDRVLTLGNGASVKALAGPETRVVDLGGRTVLPGFNDQHVHPLGAGVEDMGCHIEQGSTLAQLLANLSECVASTPKGQWIKGAQWDASSLGETPQASSLDRVSPDHPVILTDTSGHSIWANSLAMKLADITREVESPRGGVVERLPDGSPSGVFRESAIALVSRAAPRLGAEELKHALSHSLQEMARYGITSYSEAAVGYLSGVEAEMTVLKAYADETGIPLRARACLTWSPATGLKEPDIDSLIAERNLWQADHLSVDCIKIFLDGVPTDSHTAAMLAPYVDKVPGRDAGQEDIGITMVPQDELNEATARFDAMGLSVKYHAAGDAAVRAGLNAIEYARRVNGAYGPLHAVGHATFVTREDLERARDIGATIEMSPYLFSPTPINDSITTAVGEPRITRAWPVRDAIDSGALVVIGSDWAVVPSVNPWIAIETLITRERPGGSQDTFYGTSQRITLEEALAMLTINAARHLGRDHELGRLLPGYLADFIVIDRDPWKTPVRELHKVNVEMTIVGGREVYSNE